MILKQGMSGPDVEQLQLKLKAAGYDPGDIDGDYGKRTAAAVLAFQADRPDLDDDAVAGPMTLGALDAAIARKKPDPEPTRSAAAAASAVACEANTWTAFQRLVAEVTAHPVRYGPGRGLWSSGKLVVTCGPGSLVPAVAWRVLVRSRRQKRD
jgi:peptidoglycan hydrolase-like protein with peptidoglycan-binding domain